MRLLLSIQAVAWTLIAVVIGLQIGGLGHAAGTLVPVLLLDATAVGWTLLLIYTMLQWIKQPIAHDLVPIALLFSTFLIQIVALASLQLWIGARYAGSYGRPDGHASDAFDYYLLALDSNLSAGFGILLPISVGARIVFGIHVALAWFSFLILGPCLVAVLIRHVRTDRVRL